MVNQCPGSRPPCAPRADMGLPVVGDADPAAVDQEGRAVDAGDAVLDVASQDGDAGAVMRAPPVAAPCRHPTARAADPAGASGSIRRSAPGQPRPASWPRPRNPLQAAARHRASASGAMAHPTGLLDNKASPGGTTAFHLCSLYPDLGNEAKARRSGPARGCGADRMQPASFPRAPQHAPAAARRWPWARSQCWR